MGVHHGTAMGHFTIETTEISIRETFDTVMVLLK